MGLNSTIEPYPTFNYKNEFIEIWMFMRAKKSKCKKKKTIIKELDRVLLLCWASFYVNAFTLSFK